MNETFIPTSFQADDKLNLSLPADFYQILAKKDCSRDCVLLMLMFFDLLGRQETEVNLVDSFILEDFALPVMANSRDTYEIALAQALENGFLFTYTEELHPTQHYLLPATPAGEALLRQLRSGKVSVGEVGQAFPAPLERRPNIFALYEANIGVLTPMIAEQLKLDAEEFPAEWIEEAMREAVARNARNWKYVRAILNTWKEKGHKNAPEKDQGSIEKFRQLHRKQKL